MKATQLFLAATLAVGGLAAIGCDDSSSTTPPANTPTTPRATETGAAIDHAATNAADKMGTAADQATQGGREAGAKTGDAITDAINKIDNSAGKGANAPGHGGSPDTNSGAVKPGDANPLNNHSDNMPTTRPASPATPQ